MKVQFGLKPKLQKYCYKEVKVTVSSCPNLSAQGFKKNGFSDLTGAWVYLQVYRMADICTGKRTPTQQLRNYARTQPLLGASRLQCCWPNQGQLPQSIWTQFTDANHVPGLQENNLCLYQSEMNSQVSIL
jgi:hypothetical protein